jgi:hypothetical protein
MHSQSSDGINWTEPVDILYDEGQINSLRVLSTPSYLHLFWNSDCLHHASLPHTASISDAQEWMYAQSCIASQAIPEGVAATWAGNERLIVVYSNGAALNAQISIDGGATWGTEFVVASAMDADGAAILAYPAVAVYGESLYVIWEAKAPAEQNYAGRGVYFVHSADLGQSWSLPQRISDLSGAQPTIAVDQDGTRLSESPKGFICGHLMLALAGRTRLYYLTKM